MRDTLKRALKVAGKKVRDREGAIASTRGACAPRIFRVATFVFSVFHDPHETLFDLTRFRRATPHDGARRDQF